MAPEVSARLERDKRYGIWWFNRLTKTVRQVVEAEDGRRYRQRSKNGTKPCEEWVAVPVPDSGVPSAPSGQVLGNELL